MPHGPASAPSILFLALAGLSLLLPTRSAPQADADLDLARLVETLEHDPRGPFRAIRWFCPDGTVHPAGEPCLEPGGHQHALHKEAVLALREERGIYLGQILTGTPFEDFLDARHEYSRAKQYQLERYLRAVDDGWILRRARYYRGALQAEDEADWGRGFLLWLLARDDLLASRFHLCRALARDVPHGEHRDRATEIRGLARTIADSLNTFMELRVKIHGSPDSTDSVRVESFRAERGDEIGTAVDRLLEELLDEMRALYAPGGDLGGLEPFAARLPADSVVARRLAAIRERLRDGRTAGASGLEGADLTVPAAPGLAGPGGRGRGTDPAGTCREMAGLLWTVREEIGHAGAPRERLAMMDLSLRLEPILSRTAAAWHPRTIAELLEKTRILALAAAGSGYLEAWEWRELEGELHAPSGDADASLEAFLARADRLTRAIDWATARVRAEYEATASLFAGFEPLARGMIDDRVRSSILLPLGRSTARLEDLAAELAGVSNRVLDIPSQNQVRGLNPGLAVGELVVLDGSTRNPEFSAEKIYVLLRPPSDLEPVAGLLTAIEGNAVSHVQLLARNLGIPNASLSPASFEELARHDGTRVFYAVSPRGKVVLKPAAEMTPEEASLLEERTRAARKIAVPLDRLDVEARGVSSLDVVRASDAGRICGPKAANLGELRALFPDLVAPGLVIPFGVFRDHMDQPMPGEEGSFWEYLQETFRGARELRAGGAGAGPVEAHILARLGRLRAAIRRMPLRAELIGSLRGSFPAVFGAALGEVPAFVRSDTNMEDLEDFTGAGLNLTVPNVLGEESLFQAIRDVWASPYSERSYRWRQRYLENPEHVYPSIVILRSVDAEKSGVMITAGVGGGGTPRADEGVGGGGGTPQADEGVGAGGGTPQADEGDVMVAFSRGVGGAVAGQAAETWRLRSDGADILIAPAREPSYSRLAGEGGIGTARTGFERPILSEAERAALRSVARALEERLPAGLGYAGPYDVEIGFANGALVLFQVRPFVENDRALESAYLRGLDPELPAGRRVDSDRELSSL